MCHTSFSQGDDWVEAVAVKPPGFAANTDRVVLRTTLFILLVGIAVVGLGACTTLAGSEVLILLMIIATLLAIGGSVSWGMKSSNPTTATVSAAFAYLFIAIILVLAVIIGLFALCLSGMGNAPFHP